MSSICIFSIFSFSFNICHLWLKVSKKSFSKNIDLKILKVKNIQIIIYISLRLTFFSKAFSYNFRKRRPTALPHHAEMHPRGEWLVPSVLIFNLSLVKEERNGIGSLKKKVKRKKKEKKEKRKENKEKREKGQRERTNKNWNWNERIRRSKIEKKKKGKVREEERKILLSIGFFLLFDCKYTYNC